MSLYEDQEKMVDDVREAYKQGIRRPVLQGPTGFGKTRVAHNILSSASKKKKKGIFLCDRISLCEQTAQEFYKLGSRVGIIQQGYRGDTNPEILVASVQSIASRSRLPDVDLILRDECHVVREYDKLVMKTYNDILFAGLSASPWAKGMGAPGLYEKIIKGPSVQELINIGRLTDSDIWAPSKPDLHRLKLVAGEYNQKELGRITAKRVGEVVDQWFQHGFGQQTMISAVNCADSIAICDKLNERGIKAFHVDYKTKLSTMYKKGGVIDLFKAGEIQVLSSVFKLSIGIDLPNCTCLVMAAPYKSLIRHWQFWGRGIRAYEGKEVCTVIDMSGNVEELGFNTDPTPDYLDDGEKPPAQSAEYEKREPARCKAILADGKMCGAEKKGERTCPACGFTPTPEAGIASINGELVNIKNSKKANKEIGWDQKTRMMAGFKHYAAKKQYKEGWAAHAYRECTGVWPNDPRVKYAEPAEPDEFTKKKIQWLNIKRAKGRQRRTA